MKNPKISSSCSFYKESQTTDKKASDPSNFISKRMGNKTNYFPKEDPENSHKDNRNISPIDEFPSTWKKGAPKVNASKLPSAFGNIFQKTVKNKFFFLFV